MRRMIWCGALVALGFAVGCGGDDSGGSPAGGTSGASGQSGAGGAKAGSSGAGGPATGGQGGGQSTGGQGGGGAGVSGSSGQGGAATGGAGGAATGGAGGAAAGGSGGAGGAGPAGTGGGGSGGAGSGGGAGQGGAVATCAKAPGGGTATVSKPELKLVLKDRYEEAWQGSAAVADLDGDGSREVIVPRGDKLLIWSATGEVKAKVETGGGRIWAGAVVADLRPEPGLEVAFAAGDKVHMVNAAGQPMPGFPVAWVKELRSLAAADLDGDGKLELVVSPADSGDAGDVMNAWHADGTPVAGFPPNKSGVSGCDDGKCYVAGCYDQNVALGDLDGDGKADVVVGHDNAYASFHRSDGVAFDANPMFKPKKTPGVRYLHDLALAQQGYADDEETSLQAHFTNTAPAIADIDGDGQPEVVMVGSVQNAAQSDRLKGVGLWVVRRDASRLDAWQTPFHAPDYLAGLWDYDGTNIVGATNQVSIADLDPSPGLEMVFAGFDGKIHAVNAQRSELWAHPYTTDPNVLTGGVALGDLSGDGVPEVVFASYSVDEGKGALVILSSKGQLLHTVPLPRRGAMPVPTLADVDGDGVLDIVVSLKDAEDKVESVQVYTVPGSAENCLPWPTGRGNQLRNGRALLSRKPQPSPGPPSPWRRIIR